MELIIGFATEYYTLWSYSAEPQYTTDSYGNRHQTGINHKYNYLKNISTDLEKVKTLYPCVEINSELCGTSSFTRNEKIDLPNDFFWIGKYSGMKIDEIIESDFSYCLWCVKKFNTPYIKSHPKYIQHLESIEQAEKAIIENAKIVKVGDIVELEFETNGYNPNEDYTECWATAKLGDTKIKVLCNGLKQVMGRYPYLMPFVNGKAQKTKNKTIKVEVIEVISTEISNGIVEQLIRIA